jgi:hypothetical protein
MRCFIASGTTLERSPEGEDARIQRHIIKFGPLWVKKWNAFDGLLG